MTRVELHAKLLEILNSTNVYFQPPPNSQMNFPAIVYHLSGKDENYANDKLYLGMKQYSITVVDKNPDSLIPDKVADLPWTSFSQFFMADKLNHFVFETYI